jgi:hypothetical protein
VHVALQACRVQHWRWHDNVESLRFSSCFVVVAYLLCAREHCAVIFDCSICVVFVLLMPIYVDIGVVQVRWAT